MVLICLDEPESIGQQRSCIKAATIERCYKVRKNGEVYFPKSACQGNNWTCSDWCQFELLIQQSCQIDPEFWVLLGFVDSSAEAVRVDDGFAAIIAVVIHALLLVQYKQIYKQNRQMSLHLCGLLHLQTLIQDLMKIAKEKKNETTNQQKSFMQNPIDSNRNQTESKA